MTKLLFTFIIISILSPLISQTTTLSIDQAIAQAIKNNRSIKIQRMQIEVAENNVFKANAGKGIELNALGSFTYQNNFSDLKLRTFQQEPEFIEIEEGGVESWTGNVGVQADYLLYDGGRSNLRYQLLEDQSTLARAEQEILINETILTVTQLYLEIQKLQNQSEFLKENIAHTKRRIEKKRDQKQFGKATNLDILRLQTNLNEDEAALDQVDLVRTNLIKDLNFLIGWSTDEDYLVLEVVNAISIPGIDEMTNKILGDNPTLQLSKITVGLAAKELELNKLSNKPIVSTNANLGYFYQRNDVQQLARIQSVGLTLGLNARYNLFDGGVRKNRIQNAQINVEIENSTRNQLSENLLTQGLKERNNLVLLKAQLERELVNLETFEAAYTKTEDLFEVGKANLLDIRDAQLARLNSLLRIDQLKVDLIQSDLKIKSLQGTLVE